MNLFEKALTESYVTLEEKVSPMTRAQSQKVRKMQSSGWEIMKRDDNKVVMSKNNKEVFIYTTGKTFFLNEGEEIDVTDLSELVWDEEDDNVIEESLVSRVREFIATRSRLSVYEKNRNEAIGVIRRGNKYSLSHIRGQKVVHSLDNTTEDEVNEYLNSHSDFIELRNGKRILYQLERVAGIAIVASVGLTVGAALGGAVALPFVMAARMITKAIPTSVSNDISRTISSPPSDVPDEPEAFDPSSVDIELGDRASRVVSPHAIEQMKSDAADRAMRGGVFHINKFYQNLEEMMKDELEIHGL